MEMNDMILVSVDDHVVEPPDLFDGHLPAKYADDAPKLIQRDDGTDVWVFEGQSCPTSGSTPSPAGRPRSTASSPTVVRRDARRAATTSTSASSDMNANGVLGSMCFPSLPAVLRPAVRPRRGQGRRPGHAAGLQRLAHRRVVRHATRAGSSRCRSRRSGTPS